MDSALPPEIRGRKDINFGKDTTIPEICLINGVKMPCIGLGTHRMTESDLRYIIPIALDLGYRLFDTAVGYRNEAYLGTVLAEELPKRGLTRSSIYIISKLKPIDHGYETTVQSIQSSAQHFQGYIDLYLIHWPGVAKLSTTDPRNLLLRSESWRALQDVYRAGRHLRAIGVSNYTIQHLILMREKEGKDESEDEFMWPMVNQFELHPSYHPTDLIDFCQAKGIHLQSYSTLGSGELLTQEFADRYPFLKSMIQKYGPIIAQLFSEEQQQQQLTSQYLPIPNSSVDPVADSVTDSTSASLLLTSSSILACLYLAWARQSSFSSIPKSLNPSHLCLNLLSVSVVLTEEEINFLNEIQENHQRKICWDPSKVA
jgi:diketogulonate reductase-like aldo/keto reductase